MAFSAKHINDRTAAVLQYSGGFLVFLLLWWGLSFLAGPGVLPSPAKILEVLGKPGEFSDFAGEFLRTLSRAALGFIAAWTVSIPLGLWTGASRLRLRLSFFPVFLLQGAPPLLWITPLILWLGTRGAAAPAVAFLVTLPVLTAHIQEARSQISSRDHELLNIYNSKASVIVRELYLPRLLPALRSNIHLGMMTAVKSAMVAEWFGSRDGFGRRINGFYQYFDLEHFFAWALMFLIAMGLLSSVLRFMVRHLLPARRSTHSSRTRKGTRKELQPRKGNLLDLAGSILSAKNLHVQFGERRVLANVSLNVSGSQPLVISGPSGCGKTTLLKTLGGLYNPDSGSVTAPKPSVLLFQDDPLLEHRDALGNVLLSAMPGISEEDIRQASHYLQIWGLADRAGNFPDELSGGMIKRLAMARAWFTQPGCLLLDEPFHNLDRPARLSIWEKLFEEHRRLQIPMIIVTHYPEEPRSVAGEYCRYVAWEDLVTE